MLSFKNYYQLNERQNDIANSVNTNVKAIIKSLLNDFKAKLDNNIKAQFKDIKTDYEYLYAGLYITSNKALDNNKNNYIFFNKPIDIKFRNRTIKLPIKFIIALDKEGAVDGAFTTDTNEENPEIDIYIDPIDLTSDIKNKVSIIRSLANDLSHELNHCYQWLSKNTYTKGKAELAVDNIPGFSSLVYYTTQSEIESICSSAYTIYKSKGKKVSFFNILLRFIDHAISPIENQEEDDPNYDPLFDYKLTTDFLTNKYKKHNDYDDLFVMQYWLGCALLETRYYKLIASDSRYKEYIKAINKKELKQIVEIIHEIYNIIEKRFLDKTYNAQAAYNTMRKKKTILQLVSSIDNAKSILDKIKNNRFTQDEYISDEEEDEIIKGRPDLTL